MKRIPVWRVLAILVASAALLLGACGSDDDDGAADDGEETPTSEAAEETDDGETDEDTADEGTAEESETDEGAAEEDTAEEGETEDESASGGTEVTLNDDFEILVAGDVAAGSVTFNVANVGPDFPHALTIVRAASIDDLPINEANGAVDTDAMDPADIIGSTSVPMASGTAEDLTVDLEAGDYVFFCPIQDETRSHVGAGQIISVSVAG